jgi:Zn-dependent protease/predicted transcriptional regulator
MFGKKITIFKIFGFTVSIDLSWFLIFILITWSLATGVFPSQFSSLSKMAHWIMGVSAALGLFLSVVLHELMHSLIARRYGQPMKGITLFIFGGVAEMEEEPPNPKAEFSMAVAGPITSVFIALIFFGLSVLVKNTGVPVAIYGILRYLFFINGALAAFNLVPAFPLDGGRILRSAIWKSKKNLKRATRITSRIGIGFGFLLIALGVVTFLFGGFIGGMWWFLVGLFLINAARSSYQQLLIRRALEGEKVSRFMRTDTITVTPEITIHELVENYVYKYHFKLFPVVKNGKLIGCITTKQIKQVERSEWETRRAKDLAENCTEINSVHPDTDAIKVLGQMSRNNMSRLMVVEDDTLLGIISLKDMLKFISLRVELEQQ